MKLDQKVLGHYGATDDIVLASWMLPDGTLVNGSREGNQRDFDHRDIQQFYPSLSGYEAVQAFMRHGAVRMGCDAGLISFEFTRPLSTGQKSRLGALAMAALAASALSGNAPQFCAIRYGRKGRRTCEDAPAFAAYLANYCRFNIFADPAWQPASFGRDLEWARGQLGT